MRSPFDRLVDMPVAEWRKLTAAVRRWLAYGRPWPAPQPLVALFLTPPTGEEWREMLGTLREARQYAAASGNASPADALRAKREWRAKYQREYRKGRRRRVRRSA